MLSKINEELQNAKLPLWLAFHDIPRYSIGWRMGEGGGYAWDFFKWWETLSVSARQEYQQRYPEPIGWRGWYCDEDWDEDEEEEEAPKSTGYDVDGF
jgi:hypothetical protein